MNRDKIMTVKELIKFLDSAVKDSGLELNLSVYTVVSDMGALPVNSVYIDATLGLIIDSYPEPFSSQK